MLQDFLLNALSKSERFCELENAIKTSDFPALCVGIDEENAALVCMLLAKKLNRKAIFLTPDIPGCKKFVSHFCALNQKNNVILPPIEFVFDNIYSVSKSDIHEKNNALYKILNNDYDAIFSTFDSVCLPVIPKETLKENSFSLKVSDIIEIDSLIKKLVDIGYEKCDSVSGKGTFARRGYIVDIFSPANKNPIRIEFFDNEIDQIGYFDVLSQRKIENINETDIIPASNYIFNDNKKSELISKLKKLKLKSENANEILNHDIEKIQNGVIFNGIDRYIPLIYDKIETIFDYVQDPIVFIIDYKSQKKSLEFFEWKFKTDVKRLSENEVPFVKKGDYYLNFENLKNKILENNTVFISLLSPGNLDTRLSIISDFKIKQNPIAISFDDFFFDAIEKYQNDDYTVILSVPNEARKNAVCDRLFGYKVNTDGIKQGKLNIVESDFVNGFEISYLKIVVICDYVVKKRPLNKRNKVKKSKRIESFDDISVGDYVVHVNHGIGIYNGIKKIESRGVTKDYIEILYDKNDILYVPCPQLDMISKYMGAGENISVKLNRLGSSAWEKTKSKVYDNTRIIAKDLIELYAKRLNESGYQFSKDTDWQNQFEQNFEFEETADQIRSINEIKKDMESPHPMDRLLLGDVGMGKTEVALRAIFKAVCDSKQVAVLVPTTVLAMQHFETFTKRFQNFPIKCAVLNRLVSKAKQEKIIKALKSGEIDVVIGTHRILQKDIAFKDLGLLVVDEEQRFGVTHKEAIKKMSSGVDVLTLSATPIPRTLNMALSGIRDMSMIEEAPLDRYPVTTYVLEYDEDIILQAISREIRRNGCVFYLKNDIRSLENTVNFISRNIKDARVAYAHGQMAPRDLENIFEDVLNHKIDVLVCTTIIETGIDISFANTMIIEDSDRFGLSQLHQIRGRIGRSNVHAFAYLCYRKDKVLSEVSQKRLSAIREFCEFGSGFKIAMRDLEIRGAGSVLGEKQHGHINIVGYDLYMKILSESIAEQTGKEVKIKPDCSVDINISAFICPTYVENELTRIELYKKISAAENQADYLDIMDELCDRFGKVPKEVENLIKISVIRNMAREKNITDIKQKDDNIVFYIKDITPQKISDISSKYKGRVFLSYSAKPYLTLRLKNEDKITQILDFLKEF